MLSLLDPQTDHWQVQLHRRTVRKAQLLQQGRLLTTAYQTGCLRETLDQMKDERQGQHPVDENDLVFYQVYSACGASGSDEGPF